MKKIILIVLLLLLSTYSISFADNLNLSGEGAILIDWDTGQILYEKNSHKELYPASTTKIMTGILAIEHGNMEDIVTIDEEVVRLTEGSHIALEPGEQLKFNDLVNALLIESANDAAVAIAKHISGSVEGFAKLMNEKARDLGTLNTNFVNPNGLNDENHFTTAYDLALIAKYAMGNDDFRQIVNNYTYSIPETNKKSEARYLKSANRLLYSNQKIDVDGKAVPIKYDGISGIKTGYTVAAQNCLVASAQRGNQKIIAVVLKSNGKEIYSDIHKLLNYGFNNYEKVNITFKNEFIDNIKVTNGMNPLVAGVIKDNLSVSIPKGNLDKVERKMYLEDTVEAPIEKGQSLGIVEYYLQGQLLGQADIVSTLSIDKVPAISTFSKILDKWYIILIILLVIARIISISKQKQKRRRRSTLYRAHDSFR